MDDTKVKLWMLIWILIFLFLDTIRANKHLEDSVPVEVLSADTNFKTSGIKDNAEMTGLTLEKCYGGIGRLFGSTTKKKGNLTKKGKCCCVCCGRQIPDRSSKALKNLRVGSEKYHCPHVTAEISKYYDVGPNGGPAKMIECSVADSKLSLQRFTNTESTATHGLRDPKSHVVSGTVQHYDGSRNIRRRSDRLARTTTRGEGKCICQLCCMECCPEACYDGCGNCLICSIGGFVWCIDKGCRLCCGLLCKALDKCFGCCC